MFLGGDSDEGEMVCGVQVPHQAAGPLYQLGNLRRVLQTHKGHRSDPSHEHSFHAQLRHPVDKVHRSDK
jgi:hypothetical protein